MCLTQFQSDDAFLESMSPSPQDPPYHHYPQSRSCHLSPGQGVSPGASNLHEACSAFCLQRSLVRKPYGRIPEGSPEVAE